MNIPFGGRVVRKRLIAWRRFKPQCRRVSSIFNSKDLR